MELSAEQLNVKFICYWPEAGGDFYLDNVTKDNFIVRPHEKLTDKLAEVRAKFEVSND
jgi:hypothetical protein